MRDSAIRSLEAFLSRGSGDEGDAYEPLSDAEMAKLWKGLFYCECNNHQVSHTTHH